MRVVHSRLFSSRLSAAVAQFCNVVSTGYRLAEGMALQRGAIWSPLYRIANPNVGTFAGMGIVHNMHATSADSACSDRSHLPGQDQPLSSILQFHLSPQEYSGGILHKLL